MKLSPTMPYLWALLLVAAAAVQAQGPGHLPSVNDHSAGGLAGKNVGMVQVDEESSARPCMTLSSILDKGTILESLERGETYLLELDRPKNQGYEKQESSSPLPAGIALAAVKADLSDVIEILADDSSFADVFPYVAEVKSREVGAKTLVYQFIDLPFPIRNLWYEVLVERKREESSTGSCFQSQWNYVPGSGNIVDTEGRWELFQREGGSLLIAYVAWMEAGGVIPRFAEKWATKRALPKVIEALKGEIERRTPLGKEP